MRRIVFVLAAFCLVGPVRGEEAPGPEWKRLLAGLEARIERLSAQVEERGAQITAQRTQIEELRREIERLRAGLGARSEFAPVLTTAVLPEARPAPQARDERAGEQLQELRKSLNGFRFSGDFRYRLDMQLRSSNPVAGPLQNIRSRYRLRLNVDKKLDPRLDFHLQLSTAPLNNGITNDQDMGATVAKHLVTIAEAYVGFRPSSKVELRGGRMAEVFADNMRFLWDDDVRFNGFQQVVTLSLGSGALPFQSVELRAGEYFLSHPNVAILPASSPFVSAGYKPGGKVGDANLFHPGVVLKGGWGEGWKHQLIADVQLYRNANQIQLASLASGYPVLVNNSLGVSLAGPMTGTGNATTTPGGAIYSAGHFQIARLAYRLEDSRFTVGGRTMPAWVDFQVARNVGAGRLRDAFMASANLGAVNGFGDMRFLYQFAIKDANSLISQFTDDDLGTGTGVNIAVHALRFDLGLARFLQWQHLLFIQNARRASNPAEQFFVPLPRGTRTTFRYLGQLAFSF